MVSTNGQAGFNIEGLFYPTPKAFRLGDPVLVREVTGLPWAEFCELLDGADDDIDPVAMTGLIAVAVWQAQPRWTRARVARYLEGIDIDKVEGQGGDDLPPVETVKDEEEAGSLTSPDNANDSPGYASVTSTPPSSGTPPSGDGSQDSTPE